MNSSNPISRTAVYFKRHGLRATLRRFALAAKRALFSSRMVLFYCDLRAPLSRAAELPNSLKVERYRNQADLTPEELQEITSFWNPDLARNNLNERFKLGASIWLIKLQNKLAGYGWTLQGRTVEPHYFPLGEDDVQFLDFHVFPKYRGRALDWFLMTHILHQLAADGRARAFGEAAEWNKASLSSFGMTPFRRMGWARKFTVFGRTFVCWGENKKEEDSKKREEGKIVYQKGKGALRNTSVTAVTSKDAKIPNLRA
jgi:ribosomal protein S18 acetylase RimI-like enzyme